MIIKTKVPITAIEKNLNLTLNSTPVIFDQNPIKDNGMTIFTSKSLMNLFLGKNKEIVMNINGKELNLSFLFSEEKKKWKIIKPLSLEVEILQS